MKALALNFELATRDLKLVKASLQFIARRLLLRPDRDEERALVAARDEEGLNLVAVALRPGHTLRAGRRYGALVTRGVRGGAGSDGAPVLPADPLAAASTSSTSPTAGG